MTMSLQQSERLTSDFENITENVVRNHFVPILTKTGILIGPYHIKNIGDNYVIMSKGKVYYKTYTKVAAMILARMLIKRFDKQVCSQVLSSDRIAFFTKNDLLIYKNQFENAEKSNNVIKMNVFSDRFDAAETRYNQARRSLVKIYHSLF
jgi:hypothetical protein